MNSTGPRVSVIIATFNQARYLADCIDSIRSQDFDDVEIIVVNDGSTDNTAEVAGQFKDIVLIHQENLGQGEAVNNGIANAHGELVAFLDSDDLLAANSLAARVARFDDDPELDYSQGMLVEFVDRDAGDEPSLHRADGRPVPGILSGTTMVRREALDRVGAMRTDVKVASFMDWLMRARDLNLEFYLHPDVLLERRIHGDNIGTRDRELRREYVRMLKLALDRRRKSET